MPAKKTVRTGRSTPKRATRPTRTSETGRYTPPIPRSQRVSPKWVPVLMFTLLGLGTLLIILNYVNAIGHASNGKLLIGLALITGGFVTATNYH